MGWDERLFARAYRAFSAARRWSAGHADRSHGATLAALAPRLRLLACALAGADVELLPAGDDGGGIQGRRILLPPVVALGGTPETNARVYLLRLAYAAASLRLGFALPDDARSDDRALYTLLAVRTTLARCASELPAVEAMYAELAPLVLLRRPSLARLGAVDAALEALAQIHLGRSPASFAGQVTAEALAWAEAAAAETPDTMAALRATQARLSGRFGRGRLEPVALWGTLLPAAPASTALGVGPVGETPGATGTERPNPRPSPRVRHVDLGSSDIAENPAVHAFEKVKTAEEYRGGKKRVDVEDELAEHGDALDELDLREVVRANERARSLYRADLLLDGGVGDLDGAAPAAADAIAYDEWDARHGRYRPAWCSLRASRLDERRSAAEAASWHREAVERHRAHIRALRIAFARLEHARTWKGRQPDGPDIDLDALVQRHADLRSGHAPPDRLYGARRRHGHDLTALVLLDASLSTDAWVAGRRVIDVARESVLVLGEALATTSITLGIAAFASHTRRDCRFATVKGFSEPWSDGARRLASIEPAGYTRIGPALRHATSVLARAPGRRRLLLLVSDGKPTDYDRYEGRYGIADVRQAVHEAERRALDLFALAIDGEARGHLPRLFGKGRYAILPRPEALTTALARVFAELAR